MQFWPPDDEHMCSKHVEAWNKTYCETKFCAWSWLNTGINELFLGLFYETTFPEIFKFLVAALSKVMAL